MKYFHSPYSGRYAPGFRFCFRVRAIAHQSLFLPLVLKDHPKIRRLLDGESPLSVFGCDSILDARLAFSELRKKFDFAYWAATEYHIHDIEDADNIVPLRLNKVQHYMIDIMEKRHFNRQESRYVVTKTFRPCGLTTCVQAYMLWRQTFQCCNNFYTCSSSDINLFPLKSNLCRLLGRYVVPAEKWIYIPKVDRRAFYNSFRSPDFIRGINLGYVHFADMSKWKDSDGRLSARVFRASTSAVLLEYFTLVVLEGNIPKEDRFPIDRYLDRRLRFNDRMTRLRHLSNNPFFLDYVVLTHLPDSPSYLIHINLDDAFYTDSRLRIPLTRQ